MWLRVGMALLVVVFIGLPLLAALLDGLFGSGDGALGALSLLAVAGLYWHQRRQLAQLRAHVDKELAALRAHGAAGVAPSGAAGAAALPPATGQAPAPPAVEQAAVPTPTPTPTPTPIIPPSPAPVRAADDRLEVDERSARVTVSAAASLFAWFSGGNTIVRIAVLVLFVGIAFLLRYAVEHEMLPVELRLAAVAAGAVALLLVGWRLRLRRRGYALTLQGAGVGLLYMTLYAAMRLYGLLPPTATFALMVAVAGLAAVLAVRQDALPMAVVGFVGGFAAPLLSSSGAGNHVLLFGYCLVLNLAIAAIASRKAWKLLNLVGFVCTSLVAAAWGASAWRPELLASTEPFLVAHLALYLYITVTYSRQLAQRPAPASGVPIPYVDAGLVFGVPLVAAGFQALLVRHVPYALAVSAAVLSAVYLLLGRWLWRSAGERMRLLTEGLLALGAIFLMLVAPLALDARWTAAAWALQGAGMVWVALRQRRPWALHFGLVLQLLGALSFWSGLPAVGDAMFLANARFVGVLLLAASALFCARLLQRAAQADDAANMAPITPTAAMAPALLQGLHWAAMAVALLHLLAGGDLELGSAPWSTPDRLQSLVLWTALLALLLEAAHRRLAWPELAVPARPLLGLAGLLSLAAAAEAGSRGDGWSWLWPAGAATVAVVLLSAAWVLRRLDAPPAAGMPPRGSRPVEALAPVWMAMLHGALAVHAIALQFVAHHNAWEAGAVVVVPTLTAWACLSRRDAGRWPMDRHRSAWLSGLALPWMALLVVWSALVNAFGDGAMQPLPYLPLLNPVDLGHGLMLLYALRLRRALRADPGVALASALQRTRHALVLASAAVAFWWLSSVLVRTLHHGMATPMWGDGALDSGLVQTGLSILWTLIALATMLAATRRFGAAQARGVWLAGAVLLGVVVVKLMLVDLSQTSALQRIVSFVGVGLLMLVVGYVAPLPPRRPGAEPGR